MIHIESLSHTYARKTHALREITCTLSPNSVTGLIGPNGCGKSTLMEVLTGFLPIQEGRITYNGQELTSAELTALTALGNSGREFTLAHMKDLLGYARCRPTWNEKLFTHYLKRFDITVSRKALGKVSSGQSAIFSGALALASGAPLTLLDEVQATLDVPHRYAFYEEIMQLNADIIEGKHPERKFLISSHMVSELENLTNNIIIMRNGHILTEESTEDLQHRTLVLTGSIQAVTDLLAHHPDIHVLSERTLGPTQEITIDLRTCDLTPVIAESFGLLARYASLQDTFLSLIHKDA
ncbi:ATP-binding cassette domain-containing protein [Schaalia sp. lx-100]|uniref:ATP-binding cassette domain-containing protein n=1 Tax=Schaalia sp. lx-100 TaxID=2899081 RepID=UPI001E4C2379|nr:ATP-binding cassette domain-containing protein [Schaalia sp. lx-100]MCD4556662.1 ATP-binding cassette domain-containing protein [Schaalia sp. lx-100]